MPLKLTFFCVRFFISRQEAAYTQKNRAHPPWSKGIPPAAIVPGNQSVDSIRISGAQPPCFYQDSPLSLPVKLE